MIKSHQQNAHKNRKRLICFFSLFISVLFCQAQTRKIEVLREQLKNEQTSAKKLEVLMKLCEQHVSYQPEVLLEYINEARKLCQANCSEKYNIEIYYAIYKSKTGNSDAALALADSLLSIIPKSNEFRQNIFRVITIKCNSLIRSDKPKEAIAQSLLLLERAENAKDSLFVLHAYVLIGWANMELEKNNEAIKWLRKALEYTSNEKFFEQTPFLFSNLASCYNNINNSDSALYFIDKALYYSEKAEALVGKANALNIRADIYAKQKKFEWAERDLNEALKSREQVGDLIYVISDMAQLSFFYASIQQTEKGIELANQALVMARKTNNLSKLIFIYSALAENYRVSKNDHAYGQTLAAILALKDSLYEKNSAEAMADLAAKYELQKKENIIFQQKNKISRNRYLTIVVVLFISLLALTIGLMYRNFQLVKNRKMEGQLIEQKVRAAGAIKKAQELERKRIAADLHDNLGAYAAAITNNVKQWKDKTVDETMIAQHLEENAQSMVTQLSDTIWVLKNEDLTFTKLADRFKVWMQRIMKNFPELKYHYSEVIENDVLFTPASILHLFYILKECVNNALRHSHATSLMINFKSTDNISISIADNGIGMPDDLSFGNGIQNMHERSEMISWQVRFEKNMPQGTIVHLIYTTK